MLARWPCNWCVYDNLCVHNATGCRNTGAIIAAAAACPHFAPMQRPLLLPNKVPKEIKLEVRNMPRPQSAHTGFTCVVQIEGAHMSLPARVEANKWIVCERTPYAYEAAQTEYEARVEVKWNRNHYIDAVPITLYKCDVLGSHREHADCSLCVTREPRFQCAWCGSQCVYNETCAAGAEGECPRPRIDMVRIVGWRTVADCRGLAYLQCITIPFRRCRLHISESTTLCAILTNWVPQFISTSFFVVLFIIIIYKQI